MAKIISIIVLILLIILSPPAVLAYISQDALPGDAAYPIKRKLEEGILLLVSIHPTTKAWFSIDRSKRRFRESRALLLKGNIPHKTLGELITQSQIAKDEIKRVVNISEKQKLFDEYKGSINEYKQGLSEAKKEIQEASESQPNLQPTEKPLSKTNMSPPPTARPPLPTLSPRPSPTQAPIEQPISVPQECKSSDDPIQCYIDLLDQLADQIDNQNSESDTQPILDPSLLPPEILDEADLDKYLLDLSSLNVLDIKLLLPN